MQKQLLISVHDISPKYLKEIIVIFNALKKLNIKDKEAFVVLNWDEKFDLSKDKELLNILKENFNLNQINLHGFNHYSKNKGLMEKIIFGENHSYIGEFTNLNELNLRKIFKKSILIFKKLFGRNPELFIPPRWKSSKKIRKISFENKMLFTEDSFHMFNLIKNKKVFSFAVCYDFGDNKFLNKGSIIYNRAIISLSFLFNLPLRFSLHPNDIKNGNFNYEIKLLNSLLKKGWKPYTTKNFWREI